MVKHRTDMRTFSCHYYKLDEKEKLVKNSNSACWAGLRRYEVSKKPDGNLNYGSGKYVMQEDYNTIYIDEFEMPRTKDHIDLMVKIVNEITPCELVTINKKKYIKFKMLKTYDQSLVVLNFVRNLWFEPIPFMTGSKEYNAKVGLYTDTFFETLKKSRFKDPLKKLTRANKVACEKAGAKSYYGHSNFNIASKLNIKETSQLLKYKGESTSGFLTT